MLDIKIYNHLKIVYSIIPFEISEIPGFAFLISIEIFNFIQVTFSL